LRDGRVVWCRAAGKKRTDRVGSWRSLPGPIVIGGMKA